MSIPECEIIAVVTPEICVVQEIKRVPIGFIHIS